MRPALLRPHPATAAAAALLVAACASDRATESVPTFDPTPVLFGTAEGLRSSVGVLGLVGGDPVSGTFTPAGPSDGPPIAAWRRCGWQEAALAFVCPTVTPSGVAHTYQYTPLDAAGAPLRQPAPATVAAFRIAVTARGTDPGGTFGQLRVPPLTIDQRQDVTIGGLLAGPRVVDGVMTATVDTQRDTDGDGQPDGRFTTRQTTAGLVLPSGGARWPLAGTITSVTTRAAGGAERRTVLTFDGTGVATLDVTADGVTRRCTLDLAATGAARGPRCP